MSEPISLPLEPTQPDKTCANCSTPMVGEYCYNCGQEEFTARAFSMKVFFSHMLDELFDMDSKAIKTVRYLITKPGFLTEEYWKGHIKRYLLPLKFYLFIAFVFYLMIVFVAPADLQNAREIGFAERIEKETSASGLS